MIKSKQDYIEFRQNWKTEYKQISADIVDIKKSIKEASRETSAAYLEYYNKTDIPWLDRWRDFQKFVNKLHKLQDTRIQMRNRASKMIQDLHDTRQYFKDNF